MEINYTITNNYYNIVTSQCEHLPTPVRIEMDVLYSNITQKTGINPGISEMKLRTQAMRLISGVEN